jgi:hypothetical protein
LEEREKKEEEKRNDRQQEINHNMLTRAAS